MEPAFRTRTWVRFQDVDAAGIVFFARVFDYAHDAFVAYLREIGLPLEDMLRARNLGMPLVHAEAKYAAPLRFGDVVDVAVAAPVLGDTSIKLTYELSVDGVLRATVNVTHVVVEFGAMKPTRVPDAWRAKLR